MAIYLGPGVICFITIFSWVILLPSSFFFLVQLCINLSWIRFPFLWTFSWVWSFLKKPFARTQVRNILGLWPRVAEVLRPRGVRLGLFFSFSLCFSPPAAARTVPGQLLSSSLPQWQLPAEVLSRIFTRVNCVLLESDLLGCRARCPVPSSFLCTRAALPESRIQDAFWLKMEFALLFLILSVTSVTPDKMKSSANSPCPFENWRIHSALALKFKVKVLNFLNCINDLRHVSKGLGSEVPRWISIKSKEAFRKWSPTAVLLEIRKTLSCTYKHFFT